jgi:hypothetical protein
MAERGKSGDPTIGSTLCRLPLISSPPDGRLRKKFHPQPWPVRKSIRPVWSSQAKGLDSVVRAVGDCTDTFRAGTEIVSGHGDR